MWLQTVLQGVMQFVTERISRINSLHRDDTLPVSYAWWTETVLPETFEDRNEEVLEGSVSEDGTFEMDWSLPI
jgi:hypothetical protein